jgi:hypothetical protein
MVDAGGRRVTINATMAVSVKNLLAKLTPFPRGPPNITSAIAKFDDEITRL